MTRWSLADLPDQSGRTVLVTGATSGLGLAAATALAGRGARVLLGVRDPERGRAALARLRAAGGESGDDRVDAVIVHLDLADLDSVRAAADDVRDRTGDTLHVLMNNAGVMATPLLHTADGFELQIGTNHLGHAALTWLLMPALRGAPAARVVTVSSLAHHGGVLDVDDLNFANRPYTPTTAYSQSKLANLAFAIELNRRLSANGDRVISVAAHPGLTHTELAANAMRARGRGPGAALARAAQRLVSQSVGPGALPQLYAATAPGLRGGEYVGPARLGETRGHPVPGRISRAARDPESAARLWEVTAKLTEVDPDPP